MPLRPAIPAPAKTLESLFEVVSVLKEAVEVLQRQRGTIGSSAVSFDDLVNMELINPDQMPTSR